MESIPAIAPWFSIRFSERDEHTVGNTSGMFLFYFMCFVHSFNYAFYSICMCFVCSFKYVLYFLLIIFVSLHLSLSFLWMFISLIYVKHMELPLSMKCAI